jgi:hypothetical protein
MQSQIEQMLRRNRSLLHVILNEVKDQPTVRNVYVHMCSRKLILHFVQYHANKGVTSMIK